jgi:hypothetical protein
MVVAYAILARSEEIILQWRQSQADIRYYMYIHKYSSHDWCTVHVYSLELGKGENKQLLRGNLQIKGTPPLFLLGDTCTSYINFTPLLLAV